MPPAGPVVAWVVDSTRSSPEAEEEQSAPAAAGETDPLTEVFCPTDEEAPSFYLRAIGAPGVLGLGSPVAGACTTHPALPLITNVEAQSGEAASEQSPKRIRTI